MIIPLILIWYIILILIYTVSFSKFECFVIYIDFTYIIYPSIVFLINLFSSILSISPLLLSSQHLKGLLWSCGRIVVELTTIIYLSSLVYMSSQHLKGPLCSCGRIVGGLTTIIYHSSLVYMSFQHVKGPSWLRFYGSWNYNYLCNPIQDYVSKLSVNIVWRYQRCIIRIRKSEKDRQHNGQKKKNKRINNNL